MNTTIKQIEELEQLAIEAMSNRLYKKANKMLEEALELAPDKGKLHYLLGAGYIQMGQMPEAIESMTMASQLVPDLYIAKFQLGLLHLMMGSMTKAQQSWAPLLVLAEDDPLRCFAEGLQCLQSNDFLGCREKLNLGIKYNTQMPELNQDMQNILTQLPE